MFDADWQELEEQLKRRGAEAEAAARAQERERVCIISKGDT